MVHLPGNNEQMTWSSSRLGMWERCQQQWKYRYIDGMKRPPSAAMIMGSSLDETANVVYQARIDEDDVPPVDEVFHTKFAYLSDQVEDWDKPRDSYLDNGVQVAVAWKNQIADHQEPIEVQKNVVVDLVAPLPDGTMGKYPFIAIADLIAHDDYGGQKVVDLKCKGRKMPDGEVMRSLQRQSYPMVFGSTTFEFHVMVRTKTPQKQIIRVENAQTDGDSFMKRVAIADRQVEHAIQTGDFYPNRSQQLCSKKWCGYWEQCQNENGGVIPE